MIPSSRIQWIGFLLLLMMAVRVSITPGIQHQHAHGDRPHTHRHHSHSHGSHSHSHSHEEHHADPPPLAHSHIHVSILGWEMTLSTPWTDEKTEAPIDEATARSDQSSERVHILPGELFWQSANSWGTLIQSMFDIRSPAPPGRLKLPAGNLTQSLHASRPGFSSRDRERPALPPPEDFSPRLVIR